MIKFYVLSCFKKVFGLTMGMENFIVIVPEVVIDNNLNINVKIIV